MRLIDADKLKDIKRLYHFREQYDDNLFNHIINQLPTIDAVEVVRCKDCRMNAINIDGCYVTETWCYKFSYLVEDTDFCSYGERKAQ